MDEAHFTNAPYVQRGRFRKGAQAKVPTPAKRQSATLFSAFHLRTQRVYWKRAERGTSKLFLAFLYQLHQRFPEALRIVILDNAKIHKSRAVKRLLKHHEWVELEPLEPYSPEYNPLERFWQWLKAKVYGATAFDTIEDVLRQVRQLIWHYDEGWLTSTIHFDFTFYQAILERFMMNHLLVQNCSKLEYTTSGRFFASIVLHEGGKMVKMVADYLGEHLLMFSTDYPHAESRFPESVDLALSWAEVPPDLMRQILWDNAVKAFGEP